MKKTMRTNMWMKSRNLLSTFRFKKLNRNQPIHNQLRLFVLTLFVRVKCIVMMFAGKHRKKGKIERKKGNTPKEKFRKRLTERKCRFFGLALSCGKLRLVLFHSLSRME
ncbi:hypothetical protein BLNAU_5240 [Blattamonas nauphoetae]|uniref:Uncharacterized protein n=1 Tax=Blattamonas nauphoetae TaxID=2049346 RepID=A0ABQ9Y7P5_9EUKA|nr:hypothetical protein BLNAU_5240 [Blattamonas nauphoetae]